MAGELVPLVLIPRFTSYLGAGSYVGLGLDASAYARGVVLLWRGPIVGSGTLTGFIETSEDGQTWVSQNGATGYEPSASDTPLLITLATLPRRFLRIRIELTATAVTCWCSGTLERRVA